MIQIGGNERKIIVIIAVIICLFLITGIFARKNQSKRSSKTAETTGRIEIRGFDWGPAITKAIIRFPHDLKKDQILSADIFRVKEKKKGGNSAVSSERTITDIYFSDENWIKNTTKQNELDSMFEETKSETNELDAMFEEKPEEIENTTYTK